ncbi:hypothetical protein P1X15_21425 [Runella sp. MFBS21]|uniref:hypothetical protein n=1 Tax=Runella sp. MFBS21 TaxID=3034018 RepID=UPI0023F66B58|nr:hypothetical protein [Runella sp. MFBS21]MDF7820195.1 hypothetical protein [Runella sp. MFBS21]
MKLTHLILSLGMIVQGAFAQDQYAPKVIPPSPNAAALGKFGDIPVSYYTGLVNNSIPLYTIQDQDIMVPISLSYHHGGIRVEEEASWVGLGFSLNAGGAITRTIRGRDDFRDTTGYAFNPPVDTYLPDPTANTNFMQKAIPYTNPRLDTEPDLFYYNIGGKSGKFILENKTSAPYFPLKGILLDQSDVKITCLSRTGSSIFQYQYVWEIIDENGIKYTFSEQEINTTAASSSSYSATTADSDPMPVLEYNNENAHNITAWYLTSIYSPQSNTTVLFHYNRAGKFYSVSRLSTNQIQSTSDTETSSNLSDPNCTTAYTLSSSDLANKTTVSANFSRNSYLESITFTNGKVHFVMNDREDIQRYRSDSAGSTLPYAGLVALAAIDDNSQTLLSNDILNPQKLSSIEVRDTTNSLVKKWNFSQSYFNQSVISHLSPPLNLAGNLLKYNNLRLRLDSLQEVGTNGTSTLPAYKFVYEGDSTDAYGNVLSPVLLPAKTSRAKDYWGYWNGKLANNSSPNIIPQLYYPKMAASKIGFNTYAFHVVGFGSTLNGIDRSTDTTFKKRGSLKKMKYPTGGSTEFTHETNVAIDKTEEVVTHVYEATLAQADTSFLVTNNDTYAEITFELSCDGWPYVCQDPQNSGSAGASDWYAKLSKSGSVINERYFTDWLSKSCTPNGSVSFCTYKQTIFLKLSPGIYDLAVQRTNPLFPAPRISVRTLHFTVSNEEKPIAGLRIKKIVHHDASNVARVQNFQYTNVDNSSSGVQMKVPILFNYGYPEILNIQEAAGHGVDYPCNRLWWGIKVAANSLAPLGTSASGSHVGYSRVMVSDGNGLSEYRYHNTPESPSPALFPDLPSEYNGKNGMLSKEVYFSNSNFKVREVLYDSIVAKSNVAQLYKGMRYYIGDQLLPDGETDVKVVKHVYNLPSNFWYIKQKTERVYDLTDVSNTTYTEVISTTSYNSTQHLQVTSTSTVDSKNQTQEQIFKYPHEMVSGGSSTPYQDMVNANILAPVIEKTVKVGGQTQSVETTHYQKYHSSFFKPSSVEVSQRGGPLVTKVTFDNYDTQGNLLAYTPQNGLNTTLTYHSSAGKRNLVATKTTSGQTITYDYYSLIGVKEEIDPNSLKIEYEYDSFNRLAKVKDHEGRLLKEFCYNYVGQSVPCSVGSFSGMVASVSKELLEDSSICITTITRSGTLASGQAEKDFACEEVTIQAGFTIAAGAEYEAEIKSN